jgi:hypothetical protein
MAFYKLIAALMLVALSGCCCRHCHCNHYNPPPVVAVPAAPCPPVAQPVPVLPPTAIVPPEPVPAGPASQRLSRVPEGPY